MKLNYQAIGIGGLVDLGGTMLFGTILTTMYALFVNSPAIAPYELYEKVFFAPTFILLSIAVGIVFNFIGGFVAARIANNSFVTYGVLSAIPCIIGGIFTLKNPLGSPYPDWLIYTGKIFAVVFGALGGYFCKRHITKK